MLDIEDLTKVSWTRLGLGPFRSARNVAKSKFVLNRTGVVLEHDICVDFCVDILLEQDNIATDDFCNDFCLLIFTINFRC